MRAGVRDPRSSTTRLVYKAKKMYALRLARSIPGYSASEEMAERECSGCV